MLSMLLRYSFRRFHEIQFWNTAQRGRWHPTFVGGTSQIQSQFRHGSVGRLRCLLFTRCHYFSSVSVMPLVFTLIFSVATWMSFMVCLYAIFRSNIRKSQNRLKWSFSAMEIKRLMWSMVLQMLFVSFLFFLLILFFIIPRFSNYE